MKKLLGTLPVLVLLLTLCPAWGVELPVQAEAALLMEKETGQVLYAKNEHQALEPASVTKVMPLLLVMEAIDRGTLAYDDVPGTDPPAPGHPALYHHLDGHPSGRTVPAVQHQQAHPLL